MFTWGYNKCGVLGIDNQNIMLQIKPTSNAPIKFKDPSGIDRKINISDVACGFNSMIAISDEQQIFVWGRRQGVYPQTELTLSAVEKCSQIFNCAEIHSYSPRLIKNNLIFHNIVKIFAGHSNHALLTDKGEILMQGMNDYNQLCLPKEIAEHLNFFPEFRKIDQFNDFSIKDIAIGSCGVHVICEQKTTGSKKLFGWGSNLFGQLGNSETKFTSNEPIDMSSILGDDCKDIIQVSTGAYHTLVLTNTSKIFGFGKSNVGQLSKATDEIVKLNKIEIEHGENEEIKSI